ncbi:MAG: hypothetical protein AABX03_00200 [Nanoarchaeota archaeon]
MTQEKTLKDLDCHGGSAEDFCDCEEKLREEAIKRIKNYRDDNWRSILESQDNKTLTLSYSELTLSYSESERTKIFIVDWIKNFFNITEEDLK